MIKLKSTMIIKLNIPNSWPQLFIPELLLNY